MKKLLLLALPLMISGCSFSAEGRDFKWKTLGKNEAIEVRYEANYRYFSSTADMTIKYRFIAYETVAELYVKENYNTGNEKNYYYVGTNLTVYQYEI